MPPTFAPEPLLLSELSDGPTAGKELCEVNDIPPTGARCFRFGSGETQVEIFVQRWRGHIVAYVNRCPHVGSPLDWQPDRFLDANKEHLLCATHGAVFDVMTGHCVSGPCEGQFLQSVAIEVTDAGKVMAL
ncbi:MAG: hypothetical protein CMF31_06255 [Kordiimonas sp.]|nr:hypothetical protein [Kordiimonas sp.]